VRVTALLLAIFSPFSLTAQAPEVEKDIPTIAREARPAVVLVVAYDKTRKEVGRGSGFVVSSDGKVITNYHVIEHAASAEIHFQDGAFYRVEGALAADPTKDLAVLKLKASAKDFLFLPLGDSGTVETGDQVVAIGSPLGLEGTVSSGIISSIREANDLLLERVQDIKVFQTTAPISPGSSGGALLKLDGSVIGVPSYSHSHQEAQNLNLAIPINYVTPLLAGTSLTPLAKNRSTPAEETKGELRSLADLSGTYLGVWRSTKYGASGAAVLTVDVNNESLAAKVVLTGSPIGYKGDTLEMKVEEVGDGIWTAEFKGENSALSGTGIFESGRFLGDYRYRKVRRFVWDNGQWILKKQ
jgi:S1-C subfamily serine protease